MSVNKDKKYLCEVGNSTFAKSGNLKTHMMSKHEGIKYLCYQCDSKFSSKGNLTKHMKAKTHKVSRHDNMLSM